MAMTPKKASNNYSPVPKIATSKKASLIQDITNRYRVTAREARDIVTSVTTLGKAIVTPGQNYGSTTKNKSATIIKTAGDIAKQTGEAYTAATKGKSGTSAIQLKTMNRSASGLPSDVEYKVGSSRATTRAVGKGGPIKKYIKK